MQTNPERRNSLH